MPLNLKNLDYIRQADQWTPDLGAKLAELLQHVGIGVNNLEQQTNGNTQGPPQPPGKVNGVNVSQANGHFSVSVTDHNDVYRQVQYYVEHDSDPNFTNPITVPMGTSRNMNLFLGNGARYFRAYSAYPNSAPSQAVYHGTSAAPAVVLGDGTIGPPPVVASQGSGTGPQRVGLEGPGISPWRSANGAPPVR